MSWKRAGVIVAVLAGLVGGVTANGIDAFVHSFVDTIDAGSIGFFVTAVGVVWLAVVVVRLGTRFRRRTSHRRTATASR